MGRGNAGQGKVKNAVRRDKESPFEKPYGHLLLPRRDTHMKGM